MKQISTYTLVFICFFSLFAPIFGIESGPLPVHKKYPDSKSVTLPPEEDLLTLTHILHDITFSTLIHIMYDLEDHLDYWHEQLKNARAYRLFSSQTADVVIKEHINALKHAEKIHAQALGNLHTLRQTNYSAHQYCAHSLDILSTLIPITPTANIQTKLSKAIMLMSNYKKRFDHEMYNHTKPSHIARHWWKYLLGAVAVSAIGYTLYEYKDDISQGYNDIIEALQQQWQQRIVEPIQGIVRNLSLKNNETQQKDLVKLQQEIEQLPLDINHLENILDKRKKTFEQETRTYYQRRPDIAQDKIEAYVKRHLDGDDTDVMRDLIEQGRNFKGNLYYDTKQGTVNWAKSFVTTPAEAAEQKQSCRLPEVALQLINFYKLKADKKELELQEIILNAKKLLYEGKQQWYLQEVNTMLGAMFPAALTLYATYKISAIAFSRLFFKKVVLIPLQERILSLRKMLNRFDDGKQQQLSSEATGHLLYWTHKLEQYIFQLPTEHQENFKQDILELESTLLTIKQKHEVVKRMYDVYGFLKPSD